ncbi:MAG: hypothetical protein MN733_29865 [Nitrososphaera sp.]|nr:hypothetical protein [Nitrososphaera sp.]
MNTIPVIYGEPDMNLITPPDCPSLVFVETNPCQVDKEMEQSIMVDVIHDGWVIPEPIYQGFTDTEAIQLAFIKERDWGAHKVAKELARHLGLRGYYIVPLARVVMDYGRFPQPVYQYQARTSLDGFFNRTSFNSPVADQITGEEKEKILSAYYDRVSESFEALLPTKLIKLAIHTYDERNIIGTPRAPVGLLTVPKHYQDESCIPSGAFDPLFPDTLGEFTASRRLTYELAVRLEDTGFSTALNLPYTLPTGSVEVRSQVWSFMCWLQKNFEASHLPKSDQERHSLDQIWKMLKNTNARRPTTLLYRKCLNANSEEVKQLLPEGMRQAYNWVHRFLADNFEDLVLNYKFSSRRLNSIAIEVRKDLAREPATVTRIAQPLAIGLRRYLSGGISHRRIVVA